MNDALNALVDEFGKDGMLYAVKFDEYGCWHIGVIEKESGELLASEFQYEYELND